MTGVFGMSYMYIPKTYCRYANKICFMHSVGLKWHVLGTFLVSEIYSKYMLKGTFLVCHK